MKQKIFKKVCTSCDVQFTFYKKEIKIVIGESLKFGRYAKDRYTIFCKDTIIKCPICGEQNILMRVDLT